MTPPPRSPQSHPSQTICSQFVCESKIIWGDFKKKFTFLVDMATKENFVIFVRVSAKTCDFILVKYK